MVISVKNSNPEADKLKEFLAKNAKDVIKEQLNKYVVALKEGKECWLVGEYIFKLNYCIAKYVTLHACTLF